jgi:hypothetical protein
MMRNCLALAFVLAVMGCAQGSAMAYAEPEAVRPVSWSLNSIDGRHKLTFGISTGYCVGKPKPRIDHVAKVWHRKSVVITVFLRFPKVHFGKNEGCGDVGLGMSKQIKFGHSIAHRALYDGSSSPPQRRKLHR